jgi:hypothetical protein
MIEKFAISSRWVESEFLDLNHTSKINILVSLLIPKFARDTSIEVRRTSESGHQCRGEQLPHESLADRKGSGPTGESKVAGEMAG